MSATTAECDRPDRSQALRPSPNLPLHRLCHVDAIVAAGATLVYEL
jgi:hypothetical protein